LYHCVFPREYLRQVRDKGFADIPVTLNRTKTYDFADVYQRGAWFDLFVALLQYLKSGEAKVGYLNQLHPKNALHRVYLPCGFTTYFRLFGLLLAVHRRVLTGRGIICAATSPDEEYR
jgi:hypothetical protein